MFGNKNVKILPTNCPAEPGHKNLTQGYTNKVNLLSEYNIKITLTVPAMVCEKCRKEGREVAIISPDIEDSIQKILKSIIDPLKRDFKRLPIHPYNIQLSFIDPLLEDILNKNTKSEDTSFNPERYNFLIINPKRNLNSIILSQKIKKAIYEAIDTLELRKFVSNNWKIKEEMLPSKGSSVIFSGPPGTGKTVTAEAFAMNLGRKFLPVNYAHLESKYVGEMNKNIVALFELSKKNDAILFFDEADSVLGQRLTSVTQSSDHGVNMSRSVLLTELEKHNGIVIFSTNLARNIDEAFRRRIFSFIEFELPGNEERKRLWELYLPETVPRDKDITTEKCSSESEGLSAADIQTAATKAMFSVALRIKLKEGLDIINLDDIKESINFVRLSYNVIPGRNTGTTKLIQNELIENNFSIPASK